MLCVNYWKEEMPNEAKGLTSAEKSLVWLDKWSMPAYCQFASRDLTEYCWRPEHCCLRRLWESLINFHRWHVSLWSHVWPNTSLCMFKMQLDRALIVYCWKNNNYCASQPQWPLLPDSHASVKAASIYHVNCNWQSLSMLLLTGPCVICGSFVSAMREKSC